MKALTKTRKLHKTKVRDLIFYITFIAWPVLQFCVFYLGVNINSILLSFQTYEISTAKYYFGDPLVNFKRVFTNFADYAMFKSMFKNSFIAYAANIIFGLTLGVLVAYYIYKRCKFGKFFKVMIMMPSFISSLIFVSIFKVLVDNGIPTLIEDLTGVRKVGFIANPDTSFYTILIYGLWFGAGGSMLIYLNAMEGIYSSITDAAKIDGCGYFQELIFITLPQIWKTFVVFFSVSVASYFTNSMGLYAFWGKEADPGISTFGYYLYVSVLEASPYYYPYLSAIGLVFTSIAIPVTFLVRGLMLKYGPSND